MKKIILIALLMAPNAFAAGTVTQTGGYIDIYNNLYSTVFTITADAADATVPDKASEAQYVAEMKGMCLSHADTNPGSTAPTDNYDIVLTGSNDQPLFGNALNNRDTSTSEQATPLVGGAYRLLPFDGTMTVKTSNNSVNSATVVLEVYAVKCENR